MTFLAFDAFSGCGGLTTGMKSAGFHIIGGAETNKAARVVYSLNHPEAYLFGDIRVLSPNEIMRKIGIERGALSLLAGCPPCQGFSRMRTKNRSKPINDERNDLVFDFMRLLNGLMPKTVMVENVPGLRDDWRMSETSKKLRDLGYWLDCEVVDAAVYGVPQRRKRMILMASRLGPVQIPLRKYKRRTVRNVIGHIPAPQDSRNPLHRLLAKHNPAVQERIRKIPKDGGSRSSLGLDGQLPCHRRAGFDGFKDVYGRMRWDDVAPTLTRFCVNPSKGRFLHPDQDRAISLYEAALLQSFPHSYKFPVKLGRGELSSMIGEAFPPLMAERQARYLFRHLQSAK